jgi:hypothetical protein
VAGKRGLEAAAEAGAVDGGEYSAGGDGDSNPKGRLTDAGVRYLSSRRLVCERDHERGYGS